jgi:hypothetical protein
VIETVTRRTVVYPAAASRPSRFGGGNKKVLQEWFRLLLVAGFGALAAYATYDGLYQLIAANTEGGKPDVAVHALIIFSSSLLILMIIYVLGLMRASHQLLGKAGFAVIYLILVFLSVALGFGFYWKLLNSGDAQRGEERTVILRVRSTLEFASRQIANVTSKSTALKNYSANKANEEVSKGFTCDNITGPGAGSRRDLRQADAADAAEVNTFISSNTDFMDGDIGRLISMSDEIGKVTKAEEHKKNIDRLNSEIKLITDRYNKFQEMSQLKVFGERIQTRLATKEWLDKKGARFKCPDLVLEDMMRSVVTSIQTLTPLNDIPDIPTIVGAKATIEAFTRLGNSLINVLSLASSAPFQSRISEWLDEKLGVHKAQAPEKEALVQISEQPRKGLRTDDFPALIVAAFVDLCLFVSTRRSRRYDRPILEDTDLARGLARDLRKLDRNLKAEDLFNDYVFSKRGGDYVFVPVGVPLGKADDPERDQRMRDRAMALAFVSLDRAEIGLLRRAWFPSRFFPRSALLARGHGYLENHGEFVVYRFFRNSLQEIISALVLYPQDEEAWSPPPTGASSGAPKDQGRDRTSREPPRGGDGPAGSQSQGSAPPGASEPPRASGSPRGKPPGI